MTVDIFADADVIHCDNSPNASGTNTDLVRALRRCTVRSQKIVRNLATMTSKCWFLLEVLSTPGMSEASFFNYSNLANPMLCFFANDLVLQLRRHCLFANSKSLSARIHRLLTLVNDGSLYHPAQHFEKHEQKMEMYDRFLPGFLPVFFILFPFFFSSFIVFSFFYSPFVLFFFCSSVFLFFSF